MPPITTTTVPGCRLAILVSLTALSRRRLVLAWCVLMSVIPALAPVQERDEAPPRFTAIGLLTPAVAQGPHYRVDEHVRTVVGQFE